MPNDILNDLEAILTECHKGYRNVLQGHELEEVVFRSIQEISHLRARVAKLEEHNTEMGWRLNPDRMGGQFTDEEKGRDGWL